jgi:hypothetical protein
MTGRTRYREGEHKKEESLASSVAAPGYYCELCELLNFFKNFIKILRETFSMPKFIFDLERIAEIYGDLLDLFVA